VNLSRLVPLVEKMPSYRRLVRSMMEVEDKYGVAVPSAAQPFLVAALHQRLAMPMLVVVPSSEEAQRFYGQLLLWSDDGNDRSAIILFPEPDVLPYEDLIPDPFIEQQRLQALATLLKAGGQRNRGAQSSLIIGSAAAVARKTISLGEFMAASHVVKQGMEIDPVGLLRRWIGMGYERANLVEVPGTMAQRGGIIDIYSVNSNLPARIEMLGNKVESIRLFDPQTQRSLGPVSEVEVIPSPGCSLARPDTVVDYLPLDCLVVVVEPGDIAAGIDDLDARASQMRQSQMEEGDPAEDSPIPYLAYPELEARLERAGRRLILTRWATEEDTPHSMAFGTVPSYGGRLEPFLAETEKLVGWGRRVVIVSHQAARLAELLEERGVFVSPLSSIEHPPAAGSLTLVQGSLAEGWSMGKQLVLFTDAEIFGFVKQPRLRRPRPVHHKGFLPDLSPGDYAVHIDHGIARFGGMIRLSLDGAQREYLVLEYAAGDKLYVPIDQADRVSRYIGSAAEPPALTRLGTQEWERVKRRVKESAREMAGQLLRLYALREVTPGFAFSADTPWQQELEVSFPYVETPDQIEVVRQVKEDMGKPKPMDRLVCGDVGYGKTEVALRAAFKAVMAGRQVAMLVPTTVLAQQHFTTFSERLSAFPVKVEMLSRFRSEKEQQSVLEGLKEGSVDICIGTHRLLQKDVAFKDLGLVIIDEEQRFGVSHKERLKQMRTEVDVLTLSATPIPRTLHMSLVGVRDMSTMETPPEDRLPIKTHVSGYNESLIREAIVRELERDGQVFFVHNRVRGITRIANRLEDLVPEAVIAIAHGQMSDDKLEKVMLDFTQGRVDVLVCTTIIESGLDIPNVNTLIINDADKLGLAQLYQLRGRVGRGNNRAYAYFFYGKGKRLTAAAAKRLQTIFEATELGAGFRIALKDLEIRGAGNLLGLEQSGYIAAVGFDLYCQLLSEAVKELKAGQPVAPGPTVDVTLEPMPTIDLPLSAYLPEDYVADPAVRLILYQRLAKARAIEEVSQIKGELRDRFGSLPAEAENLLYVVNLRVLAAKDGIQSISAEGRAVVIRLKGGRKFDYRQLKQARPGIKVDTTQVQLDLRLLGNRWQKVLEEVMLKLSL
jgi:transcription-repair coupling factor (superfamily II helicase)